MSDRLATDTAQSCATCAHFDRSNARCGIVAGMIRPIDVCDEWQTADDERESLSPPSLMSVQRPPAMTNNTAGDVFSEAR